VELRIEKEKNMISAKRIVPRKIVKPLQGKIKPILAGLLTTSLLTLSIR